MTCSFSDLRANPVNLSVNLRQTEKLSEFYLANGVPRYRLQTNPALLPLCWVDLRPEVLPLPYVLLVSIAALSRRSQLFW